MTKEENFRYIKNLLDKRKVEKFKNLLKIYTPEFQKAQRRPLSSSRKYQRPMRFCQTKKSAVSMINTARTALQPVQGRRTADNTAAGTI